MNNIVFFYSKKGNNRFLAHKVAKDLDCDIEEIHSRWDALLFYNAKC